MYSKIINDQNEILCIMQQYYDFNFNLSVISETEILEILGSLGEVVIARPDGIPSKFFKLCLLVIIKSIHYSSNLPLFTGVFPNCWKKSYISPTFKSGDVK